MAMELFLVAQVTCPLTGDILTGPPVPLVDDDGELREGPDAEEALRELLRARGWQNLEGDTWVSPTYQPSLQVAKKVTA